MAQPPAALVARSPLTTVYLCVRPRTSILPHPLSPRRSMHIALEMPVAIQGLWMPYRLPFLDMNNTSIVLLKVRPRLRACVRALNRPRTAVLVAHPRLVHHGLPMLHPARSVHSSPPPLAVCTADPPRPDFLPGKRAFSICLCLYHTIVSTVLIQAPRFIPISFGALAESCVALRACCPRSQTADARAQVEVHARGRVGLAARHPRRPLRRVVAGVLSLRCRVSAFAHALSAGDGAVRGGGAEDADGRQVACGSAVRACLCMPNCACPVASRCDRGSSAAHPRAPLSMYGVGGDILHSPCAAQRSRDVPRHGDWDAGAAGRAANIGR
jgi:hypothetical protein